MLWVREVSHAFGARRSQRQSARVLALPPPLRTHRSALITLPLPTERKSAVQEVLLGVFFLGAIIGGFSSGGAEVTAGTLYHFTGSYLAAIASELASLIWQFLFCRHLHSLLRLSVCPDPQPES